MCEHKVELWCFGFFVLNIKYQFVVFQGSPLHSRDMDTA